MYVMKMHTFTEHELWQSQIATLYTLVIRQFVAIYDQG